MKFLGVLNTATWNTNLFEKFWKLCNVIELNVVNNLIEL
jgi:hypothetical protein